MGMAMLLRERNFTDDGKLITEKVQAVDPYLERAAAAREIGQAPVSDSWHVATLPAFLVVEWAREAGVSLDDTDAMNDLLARKINDSDFAAFRVKEGRV